MAQMTNPLVEIADAVVATLSNGSFSQEFIPVRTFQAESDLSELGTLRVTVIPAATRSSITTRVAHQFDHDIQIGVQKKFADESELDGMMALVTEIIRYMRNRELVGIEKVFWINTENDPVFIAEHISQLHQFTSVITLTYRVFEN